MTGTKKLKIFPSSSAFMKPGGVVTEFDSACLRMILISSKQRNTYFPPLYAKIGAHHEEMYEKSLGNRPYQREISMKRDLLANVEFSGRLDFQTLDDNVVHETKASFSETFYYGVIRNGKYKLSHLAQLTSYLAHLNLSHGLIVAGYYEQNIGEEYNLSGYREFKVEVRGDGEILVDSKPSGYSVQEQLAYQYAAANVLATDSIGDRPVNAWEPQGSPCRYCPMSSICDSYDMGEIAKDELVSQGIEAVKNKRMPEPKVNPVKKRRLPK